MLLKTLLPKLLPRGTNFSLSEKELEKEISSIEVDSRKAKNGSIFFALKGKITNGVKFINEAIENGAKVVVCDQDEDVIIENSNITLIKVDKAHDFLVKMLGVFYSDLPKNIFAVTGTNGKTSVAEFCRQILEILGKKAATIGTLGVNCSDDNVSKAIKNNSLTTPDLISLYHNLSILKKHNVDFVIIEASSIGLEQGRLDGIDFKVGAFTNFSQDHLDYHKNMDDYFDCKSILFKNILSEGNLAVINSDSYRYDDIAKICNKNVLQLVSYGKNPSNFQILSAKEYGNFQYISISAKGKKYDFKISLLENFQAINIVCSLAIVVSYLNLSDSETQFLMSKLVDLTSVDGRMEMVSTLENNAKIYIDFAHTPDALENLLEMVKKQAKNRILILFGCGGDRDRAKRPLMGDIAANLADLTIITDDNPRTEDPSLIRKEIISGMESTDNIIEIGDRKAAIFEAISKLQKDDILIVAGKGHEKYQIIGKNKYDFNEKNIIMSAVNSI